MSSLNGESVFNRLPHRSIRSVSAGFLAASALLFGGCSPPGSESSTDVSVADSATTLSETLESKSSLDVQTEQLDSYFDALEQHQRWLGSVVLMVGGEVVYQRTLQAPETTEAVQGEPQHPVYHIGSITKSFTSTLVMQLVEEGKISLQDTVDRWYPGIANAPKITIEYLLTHRNGLENFTDREDYFSYYTESMDKARRLALLESLSKEFEPGDQQKYSNTGYMLLGMIAEEVTGKPFSVMLQERIAAPLDMAFTFYPVDRGSESQGKIHSSLFPSYRWQGAWETAPYTDPSVPGGAGAMVSTPSEVASYFRSLMRGNVLGESSLKVLMPLEGKLGAGILEFPYYERKGYGHNGKIDEYASVAGYFPDGDVAFAVFSNGSRVSNNDINIALLAAAYGDPIKIPNFTLAPSVEQTAALAEEISGLYRSDYMPLEIALFVEEGQLFGQATGQSKFPLTASSASEFEFAPAGIVLEVTDKDHFTLHQGGGSTPFVRK